MTNRFKQALDVGSAVNPSGLAHTFINWCREVRDEGGCTDDIKNDPACKLIVYSLAELMGMEIPILGSMALYDECKRRSEAV